MASANTLFKSHEDHRRARELEEARKAGIAPAAVDEDGKEINPHIPQYMSSAPWYLNDSKPGLKHQKDWRSHASDSNKFYDRGVKVFQATKFRKGACENCGSMSHKLKDCMERPRSKGAKWTNKHIAADEKVEDIQLETYDAKRDRWAGYDTANYTKIIDMHEKVEAQKRELKKKQELEKRFAERDGDASGSGEDSDLEDEDKITETQDAGFAKVEKRVRTTAGGASGSVRNLRIREDTAKYLLNLDANSAHYDPKSRSMREDPQPTKDPSQKAFAGDNFVRQSGDFHAWQALNLHSLTAHQKGLDIHIQAAPSQAEALHHQFRAKKEKLQVKNKDNIMATYGNASEKVDDEALLLGQTEAYVEYDASGRVIRGVETKARSRYQEDEPAALSPSDQPAKAVLGGHNGLWGSEVDGELQLDADKLAAALARQQEHLKQARPDERKRPYNAGQGAAQEEVTAEDMEAYRIKKARGEDPLNILPKDANGYAYV
ncbi:hypothetical protein WJX72_011073 [[Myrmecia] bisecta]|uniref:Pre-mRNA-splicing factor SLU7 n=1 Tax=[Myrmecia] bisecta TaxID=41462 RepID=A0AAW1Q8B8_9CHLO